MSLELFCKGRAIHTLEAVFPPFAAENNTTLIVPTSAVTFHTRYLHHGDTRDGILLLPNEFTNNLSLTDIFCENKSMAQVHILSSFKIIFYNLFDKKNLKIKIKNMDSCHMTLKYLQNKLL